MFPPYPVLRQQLTQMIRDRAEQGRDVSGLLEAVTASPDDYQELFDVGRRIDSSVSLPSWCYIEPSDWAGIVDQRLAAGPTARLSRTTFTDVPARARAGFLGSVAGCILGKPVEIMSTYDELKLALSAIGDWPLNDYISERIVSAGGLREMHPDWPESVRENIKWVPADDDINYTLLGMMTLEAHGTGFSKDDLRRMWLHNIPLGFTWGPERGFLTKQGLLMGVEDEPTMDLEALPDTWNPNSELCGAMIRADAYGYAAPGRPDIASELAWRDASMTHRGNGIYGAQFAAAAISVAFIAKDWEEIATIALSYVPSRSRFAEIVSDSIDRIREADDWVDGYRSIHGRYERYGHCKVFQETGTLINTLRFATSVGDGICKQVSQGNDTDSYGATAGAILGVFFGPGHLEDRWLAPFNDVIHTRLAGFYESSLTAAADRVANLTALSLTTR